MLYDVIWTWVWQQKWRQRYFVLYAPPSSSLAIWHHDEQTASPELCYYDDETLERQRGRITLSRNTELVEGTPLSAVQASELRYLFAVRSSGRTGSQRTYYMAASNDEDLARWLDSMRGVLKMYGHCGKNLHNIA